MTQPNCAVAPEHIHGELLDQLRPKMRRDCRDQSRPCPWVGCRYNLLLEVDPRGSLTLNDPDRAAFTFGRRPSLARCDRRPEVKKFIDNAVETLGELEETCALDVAERHGLTLMEVAELMGVSPSQIAALEYAAVDQIREHFDDYA